MSDFERALKAPLVYEGGYVNNPADPGGATNFGITQAVYNAYQADKGLIKQSVRYITQNEVRDIYKTRYWDKITAGRIWPLNAILFDAAVNSGLGNAQWMLDRVKKLYPAHLKLTPEQVRQKQLAMDFLVVRAAFFNAIVAHRPSSGVFLTGWLRRVRQQELLANQGPYAPMGLLASDELTPGNEADYTPRTDDVDAGTHLEALV